MKHPNAAMGLFGSAGLGNAVVWALDHWHYADRFPESAKIAIAGGVAGALLFIGRNGFVGTYCWLKEHLLYGNNNPQPTN